MAMETCLSGQCKCSMGSAPALFAPTPKNIYTVSKPAGNIMDNKASNFNPPAGTFGKCQSMANPITAAQTVAAKGVLTPGTCIPVFPAPWVPGSPTVLMAGMPALGNSSKLMCAYGGSVEFSTAGETKVTVPG